MCPIGTFGAMYWYQKGTAIAAMAIVVRYGWYRMASSRYVDAPYIWYSSITYHYWYVRTMHGTWYHGTMVLEYHTIWYGTMVLEYHILLVPTVVRTESCDITPFLLLIN